MVNESGEERTGRRGGYLNARFWDQKKPVAIRRDTSDDIDNDDEDDPWGDQVVRHAPEIPIHPFCPVYHLNKHERFRVNVMDLKDYTFNKALGEQLVLPAITKNLVNVLSGQGRISFEDIIEGKGAGACVLLGGPPGGGEDVDGGGLRGGHGAAPVLGAGGAAWHQPGTHRGRTLRRSWTGAAGGTRWSSWTRLTCTSPTAARTSSRKRLWRRDKQHDSVRPIV